MDKPASNKRTTLRRPMIVTQVKMGDERKYFFGYAANISRKGLFIQTVSPKDVGCEFNIEFTVPRTDILVKCRCRVVWYRKFSKSSKYEPGMGVCFEDLDMVVADRIDEWIAKDTEAEG
ncbi:MAG: PilZ domain-containing protein [Nitrospirae bacterium]|nr:PilZ domain-containing protein [Nitrospirota bacterium]